MRNMSDNEKQAVASVAIAAAVMAASIASGSGWPCLGLVLIVWLLD